MDRYDVSNSWDTNNQKPEEPLYSSGPQNVEDIICEGSDTEQTADEIQQKRYRYEKSARRYLCGCLPVIKSASLRGPLDRESGWVNPWRYQPRKEADWWQPGSKDMLFTRANVMKRAADHGLGYLFPAEALAWCKATAETEGSAERHTEQDDSMEAVKAEDSDGEYWNDGSDVEDVPKVQPQEDGVREDQICTNHPSAASTGHSLTIGMQCNDNRNSRNFIDEGISASKRPADSGWLKGSYVSKRARWDDHAISSPTPLPDLQSETGRRRRQGSARSAGSDKRRATSTSQSIIPWSHDAQQKGNVSRNDESSAHGAESEDSKRTIHHRQKDLDYLREDSRETTFVSVADLLHVSQGSLRSTPPIDHSFSDLEPDDFAIISAQDRSSTFSVLTSCSPIGQRSGSGSKRLPRLPHSLETAADNELIEDNSFVTEIAPSSRNLEKFQYRKKRSKSKQHQSDKKDQTSHEQNQNALRSPANRTAPEQNLQSSPCRASPKICSLSKTSPDGMACVVSEQHSVAPTIVETLRSTTSSTNEVELNHERISPGYRQFDNWVVVENVTHGTTPNRNENEQLNHTPAFPRVTPETRNLVTSSPKRVAEKSPLKVSRYSPTSIKASKFSVDDPLVDGFLAPDRGPLSIRSSQPERSGSLGDVPRPKRLQGSPTRSRTKPNAEKATMDLQRVLVLEDGSTQSFNSAARRSMRSPRLSLADAGRKTLAVKETIFSDETEPADMFQREDGSQEPTQKGHCNSDNPDNTNSSNSPNITRPDITNIASAIGDDIQDEMEGVQNALSQDCMSINSTNCTQSDVDYLSQPSVGSSHAELCRNTSLGPNNEIQQRSDQAQNSWPGHCPQSPWMVEKHFPGASAEIAHADQEMTTDIATSLPAVKGEDDSETQPPERPTTPENDGIKPFKDFITPTPSPEKAEVYEQQDGLSSTQQLIDAATKNPWMSNFGSRVPGKTKKRVSFGGVFLSEEREESPIPVSTVPKQVPGSPPPLRTAQRPSKEDMLGDGITGVNKFAAHFSVAYAEAKRRPSETVSLTLSSPAVGAMAEAFIAADREISIDRERRGTSDTSPSRHFKPKSEARTNISSPDRVGEGLSLIGSFSASPGETMAAVRTIDCHMEDNLDDFLGDAGRFLEDWSLEAEVKKANELRAKKDGRNDPSRTRSLFGITSGWS